MGAVPVGAIGEETPDPGGAARPHAVCERPAWPYIARGHPEKPTADAAAVERRITGGPTGPEFSKAAPDVGHAAPVCVPDGHMPCTEAVCPKEYGAAMPQAHALRQ